MSVVDIDPSFFPAPFRFRVTTKFKWDTPKVKRLLNDANRRSLKKAGRVVFNAARSSKVISRREPRKKTDIRYKIGERQGYQLYAVIDKVPKSDIVTSWRTSRFPEGFLWKSLEYDYSTSSKTVVVGPGSTRGYKVASLQAYGGTAKYWFQPFARKGQSKYSRKVYGRLTNSQPMAGGRNGVPQMGLFSFTRQLRGKEYMERATRIAVASGKIPQQWRNALRYGGGN
jgi:hypothetical protein